MGDRSEKGPDRGRIHRPATGDVPLVFREEPSRTRRLLDRLQALFRTDADDRRRTPPPRPEDGEAAPQEPASTPTPGARGAGSATLEVTPPPSPPREPARHPGGSDRPPGVVDRPPGVVDRPPGVVDRRREGVDRPTLQLLPGRLEPMDPEVIRQEVRFLRIPDPSRGVTLGWSEGAPPYHVMLHHPSIQPRHARMRFQDGQWWIENLSPEDPLMLNGRRLPVAAPPRALEDGDTVRLGRAAFTFRMP